MTEDAVRELVKQRAQRYALNKGSTGFTEWCRRKGVNKGHASDFMHGKKAPCSDLLKALGLEWRIGRRAKPRGGQ